MGIPSYYKTLCDRIPGLLSKVRKGGRPSHAWIDFNCMVYHCLRRPGAKEYPGEEGRIEFERWLIRECCSYLKKTIALMEPTEQVFVGVDGVVPMAKIKQQRQRRFKSQWLSKQETKERWDTNSITPGTAFMEALCDELKRVHVPGLRVIVSGADEPGEGEHKIMNAIRSQEVTGQGHCIYGLDADLIVLSLLQPVNELWLFREAIECGVVQYSPLQEEEYRYFSIHALREFLCEGKDTDYLLDYCMAMSLLGNDFVPHGMSFKLGGGGHDILLKMLSDVRRTVIPLIDKNTAVWRREGITACIEWLARDEERAIEAHTLKKIIRRWTPARGTTPEEIAADEFNKTPLRACDELSLVASIERTEDGKKKITLSADWGDRYMTRWLGTLNRSRVCREYLTGVDWIVKYYLGKPVSKEWAYSWLLPPLWTDLVVYLSGQKPLPTASQIEINPLKPQEQLALVMPLSSWWLVRDPTLRAIPNKAPQLWPSEIEFFTAGHMNMWECEAMIPSFNPEGLRYLLTL
jgi:5'-3' exoribonuclease 1